MAVFKRGDKWAVTVHDPATGKKRWVGTFATRQEGRGRTKRPDAGTSPARPREGRRVRRFLDRPLPAPS